MKYALVAAAAALMSAGAAAAADAPPAGMTFDQAWAMTDANKDGVATKEESGQWPAGVFERADADKDGKVTQAEAKADWDKNYAK